MNIVDVLLLLVVAISVVFAIYRGFLASLLGVAACFLSLLCALTAGPKLADAMAQNQGITDLMSTYTDAGSLIGDASLASTPIIMLNGTMIDNILKTTSLPAALHDTLRQNIQTRAFDNQGLSTISAYISATIISVLLRAAAFLICFFLCFLALHILINLIDHVFYFPVLRHLNGVSSILMGLIRGAIVVSVLLIVFPLIRSAIPFESVQQQIDGSRLLPLLYREDLFLRVLSGH